MKNLKYFPFERNKYYYGKLLSERDFVEEQRYFNDKRRLLNRILYGTGVAAGLQVLAVDDWNLSVEAGLALDFSGREILVDTPVIRRLSTIDGFDGLAGQGEKQYFYLCVEYSEEEAVPAHSVMGSLAGQEDRMDYEKYREGYRLYLTDQEPDTQLLTRQSLINCSQVIYQDEFLKITQTLPRFAEKGKPFQTILTIENSGPGSRLSGSVKEALICAGEGGKQFLEISFDNLFLEQGARVSRTFSVNAAFINQGKAEIHIVPSLFSLETDRGPVRIQQDMILQVPIIQGDPAEELDRLYYHNLMEDVIRDDYPQGIYLARIHLIHHEKTYLIDRVDPMPFDSYICTGQLLKNHLEFQNRKAEAASETSAAKEALQKIQKEPEGGKDSRIRTGKIEITLGIGAKRGQRFFSHEIFHGLGLGAVNIRLGLEEEGAVYWGSSEVFDDTEVKAELASRVFMEKGSFVIGLRMLEPTGQQKVIVHWYAESMREALKEGSLQKKLYIRPERLEMKVRETAWLEAVCPGVPGITVFWSIKTPEGGSVTQDGMYTAPSLPGVYEVSAGCQEIPELKTSIFVIVRE